MRRLSRILLALAAIVIVAAGYKLLEALVVEDIYRDRLEDLGQEYERLRGQYNAAVEKTAVTELWVEEKSVEVVVMTAAGELARIPTPYDPSEEIHVDFVVLDSRLWIRRVHDGKTPPSQGVLIDPKLANVPWDDAGEVRGLTIYRPLSEGRWIVSVTGNGALSLEKKPEGDPAQLAPPPELRTFDQVREVLRHDLADVGFMDVLRVLWKGQA